MRTEKEIYQDNKDSDIDNKVDTFHEKVCEILQSKDIIKQRPFTPYKPVVRSDYRKHTVTAEITLDLPDRPVSIKIIAGYDKWRDLAWNFLEKTWITFEEVDPFIRKKEYLKVILLETDRKDIRAVWNEDMAYRVYHAAEKACKEIRLKPKGRHAKQEHSTGEIVRVSRHVYIILEYWLTRQETEWPEELKFFLRNNHMNIENYKDSTGQTDLLQLTKEIVETYFDPILIGKGTKYFKRHYIHCKTGVSLSMLRQSYKKIGYLPIFYPLNEVFKSIP